MFDINIQYLTIRNISSFFSTHPTIILSLHTHTKKKISFFYFVMASYKFSKLALSFLNLFFKSFLCYIIILFHIHFKLLSCSVYVFSSFFLSFFHSFFLLSFLFLSFFALSISSFYSSFLSCFVSFTFFFVSLFCFFLFLSFSFFLSFSLSFLSSFFFSVFLYPCQIHPFPPPSHFTLHIMQKFCTIPCCLMNLHSFMFCF